MQEIYTMLNDKDGSIAHMKMTLSPEDGSGEIASSNVVDNESAPALGQRLMDPLASGALMINVRAETDPDILREQIPLLCQQLCDRKKMTMTLDDIECFRPAAPVPVHRMESMNEAAHD